MPAFRPEPPYQHGSAAKTAILLINLGTPDEATAPALKRYLRQFLGDRRVVELTRLIWWPVLHGIILNTRPKKSAQKYASVWTKEGSPLRAHTERQAKLLAGYLGQAGHRVVVDWAMRYGQPSIGATLDKLKAAGATRILIVPMYPQYSATTTATAIDELATWLRGVRNQPELRTIRNFHDDEGYLAALEKSVRRHWQQNGPLGDNGRLIISFHGLPKRYLELGDPYYCECKKTGRLLAERLGLTEGQYEVCFQSRFGRAEWLQPYTAPTLQKMAKSGVDRADVICPGFVADCLETLEEIAMEGKQDFLLAGGKTYHYIPALNEDDAWIAALRDLVLRHLGGWPTGTDVSAEALAASAARARAAGAPD